MKYPKELNKLIELFKKLPGVGKKTAERYVFDLLNWQEKNLVEFGKTLQNVKLSLSNCLECGALIEADGSESKCLFCDNSSREQNSLCIVSSIKDIFVIENTRSFDGLYHVLPQLLSPYENQTITEDMVLQISNRILKHGIKEIILALDSTLEGDATALFLKEHLQSEGLFISRLALGIPMGSSLDFVDEGTLSRALSGRLPY